MHVPYLPKKNINYFSSFEIELQLSVRALKRGKSTSSGGRCIYRIDEPRINVSAIGNINLSNKKLFQRINFISLWKRYQTFSQDKFYIVMEM